METDLAYLTTREVADLLRVKERKVYDLAAAGEIPHRRVTGKLLFPAAEISAWLDGGVSGARPDVLAGSHDPLLDWAVRESKCALATLYDGSMDGIARFRKGDAAVAGLHLPEQQGSNVETLSAAGLRDAVLISWAVRRQGLILGEGVEVAGLADLAGMRIALRQDGAGGRALFDRMAERTKLRPDTYVVVGPVRTETEAAAAVASGEADAALGLEAMARQFRLTFVPLHEEQFDLLIDRRSYFTPPFQRLLAFARTDEMVRKAQALGGYAIADLGEVRWVSP